MERFTGEGANVSEAIAELTGAKLAIASVGPAREQTIFV